MTPSVVEGESKDPLHKMGILRCAQNDGRFDGAVERLLLEEKLSAKLTDEVLPQDRDCGSVSGFSTSSVKNQRFLPPSPQGEGFGVRGGDGFLDCAAKPLRSK